MAISNMLTAFSRLSLQCVRPAVIRSISTTNHDGPLYFKSTNILYGEPLKKKKRMDPAVIRNRIERAKRKLEKQIRRLEKHARQLKPIEEAEVPVKLINEKNKRTRMNVEIPPEKLEERVLLEKKWAHYKYVSHLNDMQIINNIILSQDKALRELQKESEILYQAAIKNDDLLLPHNSEGPAALVGTPPIENYISPDGNYTDISLKFDGEMIIDNH